MGWTASDAFSLFPFGEFDLMKRKHNKLSVLLGLFLVAALALSSCVRQNPGASSAGSSSEDIQNLASAPTKKLLFRSLNTGTEETFGYQTDVFDVVFSTEGASIQSLSLRDHANADGEFVNLVYNEGTGRNAFMLYWGDDLTNPVSGNFRYRIDGEKIIFTGDYENESGDVFTIVKTYQFKAGEYFFKVSVEVLGDGLREGVSVARGGSAVISGGSGSAGTGEESASTVTASSSPVYAYTIAYEPQVGPGITSLGSGRSAYGDYRRFYAGLVNKNKVSKTPVKLQKDGSFFTTRDLEWLSLTGKYFTIIARPENEDVRYKWSARQSAQSGITQSNSIYVSVPEENSAENSVYFYAGPQLKRYLGSYYNGTDNAWGLRGYNLDDAMEGGSFLGWLETILKWALMMLNKIIPNYGIDIIVLTIILKILLWPLQKKSTESTAKMSSVAPLVEAIKQKYPNNPQKQNEEVQKVYKEHGINPMGGCLPLLIQFPILIAFYGLLNRHFELRGAMFIPGWIPDLSVPETVAVLPFRLPVLGSQIHLLPIIYTFSMIFSMKFTQMSNRTPSAQGGNQWLMTYGMPIFFFFILYGAPSGLLLYWTTQNALSILQQVYTNNKMKKNPGEKGKFQGKVVKTVKPTSGKGRK